MFTEALEKKYPFLSKYFESGINNPVRSLSHSILLYGSDLQAQYDFALEIARLLNCKEFKNEDCRCINCNWIREKQHPAVLTISKLDNKPSDDDSKTVISVKQSQMIKNSLLTTSDYHRVFIFCDAKIEDGKWVAMGLNGLNFQEETANSLLKIIEEPPSNTTFFFLTRDKSDLIETIISRSQSFFVPSYNFENSGYDSVKDIFEDYPNIERKQCFDIAQSIFSLTKEKDSQAVLQEIQNYLVAILKSNLENTGLKNKILNDINQVELAKKQICARIMPQLAIENMCLNIFK